MNNKEDGGLPSSPLQRRHSSSPLLILDGIPDWQTLSCATKFCIGVGGEGSVVNLSGKPKDLSSVLRTRVRDAGMVVSTGNPVLGRPRHAGVWDSVSLGDSDCQARKRLYLKKQGR